MHTHVTVLSTARIAHALGVHGNGIEGTEMAADAPNLLLKDLVVETSLELALAVVGRRDIARFLASAENDKVLDGSDGGGVEGGVSLVGLEGLEGGGVDDLDQYQHFVLEVPACENIPPWKPCPCTQ